MLAQTALGWDGMPSNGMEAAPLWEKIRSITLEYGDAAGRHHHAGLLTRGEGMTETRIRTRLSRSAALVATVLGLSAIAVPASADLTLNNDQILAVRQAVMRTNSAFNGLVAAQAKGAVTIPPDQLKAIGEAW